MCKLVNKVLFSALLISSISANASPLYGTSVNGGGFNNNDGSFLPGANTFQNFLGATASSSLTNETYQDLRYYGLNQDEPVSTTVTYSGQARSSSTGLQSIVSGQQFSEIFTPVLTDDLKSGQAQYSVDARATFSDTLSVTGASGLSSIQFDVNIHGTRSNAPFGSFIQVDGSGVIFGSNDSTWDGVNDFNLVLQSGVLDINNGSVDVNLSLLTSLDFFLGGEGIENDFLGIYREVDFFNTVTINQFKGFNASGELIDLSSVIGSDGLAFDTLRVATVPVPAAVWLFGTGLIGLVGMGRKSSKVPALSA